MKENREQSRSRAARHDARFACFLPLRVAEQWGEGRDEVFPLFRFSRHMPFIKGQSYPGAAIVEELGAERGIPFYALHRNGHVLAFALNRWQNPGAPSEIIVGIGDSREEYAESFIADRPVVPVFIKEQPDDALWTCMGRFKFSRFSDKPADKNARLNPPTIPAIYKILFLEEVR